MRRKFLSTVLLSYFLVKCLSAQSLLEGQVVAPDGEPLPFVNIVVNQDNNWGTTTNIDGYFELTVDRPIRQVRFSYVGYRDLSLAPDTVDLRSPWRVVLQPQAYDIAPIEVIAGINPADVIMQRVIRNRYRNDPEKLKSYRCLTYNKVVLSWLPRREAYEEKLRDRLKPGDSLSVNKRRRRLLRLMEGADQYHLFIMESLTERRFRRPLAYSETVLANKVSGFSEAPFVALANDVQPFSFYQEEVMLLDKPYLNPVSPGSPERYFFQLEDTLYRQQDTVYLIAFHPRQGKNFNGLQGTLYINTHRYGIQNIIAEPADTSLLHFRIEQSYNRPDRIHWFPAELNYEIRLPKYPHPYLGLQIQGKSYIRQADLNLTLDPEVFDHPDRYVFADSAHRFPFEAWSKERARPLDTLERNTYQLVDSLGEAHHFDRWLHRLEGLGRGRWPLGLLDLSLPALVQFNQYENIRLGLGWYTSEQVASWFTFGAHAGYGLNDQSWKYGVEMHFFPDWDRRWDWQWYYQKDLREAGGELFPLRSNLITRRLFAGRMDQEEVYGTFFRAEPLRYLQIGLEATHSRLTPLYPYALRRSPGGEPLREFRFSEATFYLRYAHGQQYRRILGQRVPDGSDLPFPVLSASVRRGFGPAWRGAFPYWQFWVAIDHSFRLLHLGRMTFQLEGASTFGPLPVSRLYSSAGAGREFQWLTVGQIFQTMQPYEFLSDRYFSFFFKHEFGSLLFKTKWLQPAISVEHHFAIGDLAHPEQHEEVSFSTLEKGYTEVGLVIDNLLRLNYVNFAYLGFGGGLYYRYGAYRLPGGVGENLAFRLSLALDF